MTASPSGAVRPGTVPPRAGHAGSFRPDIEGLRAVAVLAVVLFHAGVSGVPGGFVGVDVFFVISGFLITGMLWREVAATGTIRLRRFYAARARRLLPAGVLVMAATAPAVAWLLPPLQARTALLDGVASSLYVANYRFAVQGTDYLSADVPPSPFQHYWSLSVEEQFYVLWPALLIATAWLFLRRGAPGTARSARAPAVVLLVVVAASFALSVRWTGETPSWAFFSLPSRAWQLGVGGLVALGAGLWRRVPGPVAVAAGWAGLALIAAACVGLDEATPYPGSAAVVPVLGAALVVGAGCARTRGAADSVLALPPMQWIGRISYSWYLWHWPVLLLAPAVVGHALGPAGRLLAAAVSALLAVGTTWVVEDPVRFGRLRRHPGRSLALGGALTVLGVCASLVALVAVPPPVGRGPEARAPDIGGREAPATPVGPEQTPEEAALEQVTAQVQAAVAASSDVQAVPANLAPPLAQAGARPPVFLSGCVRSWLYVGQPECASGVPASTTTVALVGDSHAAMWQPALEDITTRRQWRLETMGKVTCPLQDLPIVSPYLDREYTECVQWRGQILERLHAEHPAVVVLGTARHYTPDFSFTVYSKEWLDSLTRTVAELRSTGAAVLVLGPIPHPTANVPACLSAHLDSAGTCAPERSSLDDAGVAAEARATEAGNGTYADLTDLFCTASRCPVVVGNHLVYRDDNHVTPEYARWLAPVVDAELARLLAAG